MADAVAVSIVVEVHCYVRGNKASLWLIPGAYDFDDDDLPDHGDLPGATKFAGPIADDQCRAMQCALKDVLLQAGVQVVEFMMADD